MKQKTGQASTNVTGRMMGTAKNPEIMKALFTLIRIFVGWHFFYEGVTKLRSSWSCAGFLMESQWLFSGVFHWIAQTPAVLHVVDWLNMIGILAVGLGLFFGLFTRLSAFTGAFLILLYYIANPPFVGYMSEVTGEGSYLIVNKQLIELAMLLAMALLPKDLFWGVDRWIARAWERRAAERDANRSSVYSSGRRELLKDLIAFPFVGVFSWAFAKKMKWESFEELKLVSQKSRVDAISSATIKAEFANLAQLKGKVPLGKIKGHEISRLIFGGGIVSGYAHSRDLIYVSPLIQAYNNDEKVIQTLKLCEAVGINTMILRVDNNTLKILKKYRKRGGSLKWLAQCRITEQNIKPDIDAAFANGAIGLYIQGIDCDLLVRDKKLHVLSSVLGYIRQKDPTGQFICGFAAHDLKVVVECEKQGLKPDFYMKTFNSAGYWTAGPRLIQDPNWKPDPSGDAIVSEYGGSITEPGHHDNMWCNTPQQTMEFMKKVEKPWVAYKVLGAGAIHPSKGFEFAFKNGADFACVGMFDFQIVENANIACAAISKSAKRERPWRG